MTSIPEVLELLGPRLPGHWVSPSGLRRIRGATKRLPEGSTVLFVERHLVKKKGRVDFGLYYPYPAHRAVLDGDELLARRVPFLWLEVDAARVREETSPGVLLCVDGELGIKSCGRGVPRLTERRLLRLGEAAHRRFLHRRMPRELRQSLRRCFLGLPERGRIQHLSLMPSRNPPVTKLNVVMPKRALASYLRDVGWSGSFSGLEAAWGRIAPHVHAAKIDLTLSPAEHPKLGLEVVPSNASVRGRRAVLAWLRAEGLAESRRSAELAAWHGRRWMRADGRLTPIELDFGMKVVLDAASSLDAKAYLHFTSESPSGSTQRLSNRRHSHA